MKINLGTDGDAAIIMIRKTVGFATAQPTLLALLKNHAYGLGSDIKRGEDGKPCEDILREIRRAQESTEMQAAVEKFGECVHKKITALDDRSSGADIVAKGVIATCSKILKNQDPEVVRLMLEQTTPTVTGWVLEHRAISKK